MNIELKIKIAIIRRVSLQMGAVYCHSKIASEILGCKVAEDTIIYVCGNTNDKIVGDVYDGVPVALGLDDLIANWE